jgi:hypothetical protein
MLGTSRNPGRKLAFPLADDGKRVLTGSRDGMVRLWDCTAGRELCRLISFSDGA